MNEELIVGCILGTAVGDALGLPFEGLSRVRAERLLGSPERHRFFFGRGMVSDDTEHTCMVAKSLIIANGDIDKFEHSLAWELRRWLLGFPAGIGIATLRATIRLWLGYSPERSGVNSAGNGPAMRAAILGVAIPDASTLCKFHRVSTRMTHTDPKAEMGSFAVALAAQMAAQNTTVAPEEFLKNLKSQLSVDGSELVALISRVLESISSGQSTDEFADAMGLTTGVSGYIYHSVPVAIHAWLSFQQDYRRAVLAVIRCGGDTDSTAAIVGGIVGAAVGRSGIPADWLSGILEWPRSIGWMETLGKQLASLGTSTCEVRPPRLPYIGLLARNLFFLTVVLYHGFRRLAPPY